MKRLSAGVRKVIGVAVAGAGMSAVMMAEPPTRLKRSESFLGVHFDFHAGPDCTEIGKSTTREMIERIIDRVKPDYLQIDGKGHPGFSSYPTRVGQPAPGFVGDPLRLWREVTAARGVALYLHYSGVWDGEAVKQPGWAAVNADGSLQDKATSFWGPYLQQRMLPQLREIAGEYGLDGVWIDGDCWAAVPDYRPEALAAFTAATGVTVAPRKRGDPHWQEFLAFHREAFRRYLRTTVDTMKRSHPDFQVCSNWAFSDHMPEPVSADVAFLSGDYSPGDSVNSARLAGRFLAQQGRPWDLMAWSFAIKPERREKSVVQVQREAALVLAQGGGFQAYFSQRRDGSVDLATMDVMAEVAAFCRARQPWAYHSQSVPEIAVLLSQADTYHNNDALFARRHASVRGVLQALLDRRHAVDVVGEHMLENRLSQYALVVVPECSYLDPGFRDRLVAYAREGGKLLLVGPTAVALFEQALDLRWRGQRDQAATVRWVDGDRMAQLPARLGMAIPPSGARLIGELTTAGDSFATPAPAASIQALGRGKVASVYFSAGRAYAEGGAPEVGNLLDRLVREEFPSPQVVVEGSPEVEVVVATQRGRRLVHLINVSGPHATAPVLETVDPVGPLTVSIRLPERPRAIVSQPEGRELPFTYEAGIARVRVPSVKVYDILVVEPDGAKG